jgi:hypothetical protein
MRRLRAAFDAGRELSAHDAEQIAFLHIRRVREYLKWLHKHNEVHIDRWERRHKQGPWHPVYAGGPGPDAQRPAGKTNAEMMRSYRERRRVPRPEPIIQALFLMRPK